MVGRMWEERGGGRNGGKDVGRKGVRDGGNDVGRWRQDCVTVLVKDKTTQKPASILLALGLQIANHMVYLHQSLKEDE